MRWASNITHQNALRQSIIAIALLSALPITTLAYSSAMLWFQPVQISRQILLVVYASTALQISAGLLIILKYPKNIVKLRGYIEEMASGSLPDDINLLDTRSSDELRFIERGLSMIVNGMRQQLETSQQREQKEKVLRMAIEQQQLFIVKEAHRRAMIQSIATACSHLPPPLTLMDLRLYLIKLIDRMPREEREHIAKCEQILYELMNIMEKIQRIEEPQTKQNIDEDGDIPLLAI